MNNFIKIRIRILCAYNLTDNISKFPFICSRTVNVQSFKSMIYHAVQYYSTVFDLNAVSGTESVSVSESLFLFLFGSSNKFRIQIRIKISNTADPDPKLNEKSDPDTDPKQIISDLQH
jgi:hypothetical protein